MYGWPAQADLLGRKYANVSLADRAPQAMWRGRTHDALYPQRDRLRWACEGERRAGQGGQCSSAARRRGGRLRDGVCRQPAIHPSAASLCQARLCGVPPRAAARRAAAGRRTVLGVAAAGGAPGRLRLPVRAVESSAWRKRCSIAACLPRDCCASAPIEPSPPLSSCLLQSLQLQRLPGE